MTKNSLNNLLIWTTAIFLGLRCELTLYGGTYNLYEEAAQRTSVMRDRVHGYLQVRPGAHLFYQLFYANGTKLGAYNKPLFIWIQGGPGYAASGIGTFAEIGPLDLYFEPRNHTWVKKGNVLLIDHPVGTGFSYAAHPSLHVKTDHGMAVDLSTAITLFLKIYKNFRKTPTYVVGQSYGGKICPRLALYLCRGATDPKTYTEAKVMSKKMAKHMETQNYKRVFEIWNNLNKLLYSKKIDNFYNYMKSTIDFLWLECVVNYYVKPTLTNVNQSIIWEYVTRDSYAGLDKNNILKSSYTFLEYLLNYSNLKVVIYNGNLDVMTPVAGAANWVQKLSWYGAANFSKASIHPIKGERNGYYKAWGKLSFWSVWGAGHWVPDENPQAMDHILDYLILEV